jgi:hypothetical protein
MIDAREAEEIVESLYPQFGPIPYFIQTLKRGTTYVVKYQIQTIMDTEEHTVHIDANTGRIISRR